MTVPFVKLAINNSCNLNCPYCFLKGGEKKVLDIEDFKNILYKLHHEVGVDVVDFFGKEPMYDDTMFRLLEYAESELPYMVFSCITNGKNLEWYLTEIKRHDNLSAITVSYNTFGERTFKVPFSVLRELKDGHKWVELSLDLTGGNVEETKRFLLENAGAENPVANSFYVNPIVPTSDYDSSALIDEETLGGFVKDLEGVDFDVNVQVKIPFVFKNLTSKYAYYDGKPLTVFAEPKCTAGSGHFYIDCDGYAYGCNEMCAKGITENTCDFLNTPVEKLAGILCSHSSKRGCRG